MKATNQLPSPTGVALAILRLTAADKATAQEIASVLQTDPALSGRILKLANSPFSGRARPVNSVCKAVTYLGARMVRNTFQAITHPEDLDADLENVRRLVAATVDSYQEAVTCS